MTADDVHAVTQPADSRAGLFGWWRVGAARGAARARRRRRSAGCSTAFDVMLYALVLRVADDRPRARRSRPPGCLGSLTLLAAAVGGIVFGVIADRFGRTRALMASVLIYSVFTAACGFAQTVVQLAVFRIVPRHRHGRRVGERRGARLRDVAGASIAARRSA